MADRGAIPQPLPTLQNNSARRRSQVSAASPQPAALAQSLQVHLQALADEILLLSGGDGIAIGLAENGELRCRAASGIAPPLGTRIDARSGLTGACLNTGTLLRCDDSEQDARVDRQVCRALGIRAMVCVPVSAGQEVVGIFEIFSCRPNAFHKLDSAALHGKAQEIANCFTAEEALARAAVANATELGTAGDLARSWTPAPPLAHRPARLRLSSRAWQAVLGALVLALGFFLVLRAIRASGLRLDYAPTGLRRNFRSRIALGGHPPARPAPDPAVASPPPLCHRGAEVKRAQGFHCRGFRPCQSF